MTQEERILTHLQARGSITSMEAFEKYGTTRLSAVIYKLRKHGIAIDSNDESAKNRYGKIVYYTRYTLKGGAET